MTQLPPHNKHLTECPACNGSISKKAPLCPHCGHPSKNLIKVDLITIDAIAGIGCGTALASIIIVILFGIIGAVFGIFGLGALLATPPPN